MFVLVPYQQNMVCLSVPTHFLLKIITISEITMFVYNQNRVFVVMTIWAFHLLFFSITQILVGGFKQFLFSISYGMSSLPLTNSHISRWLKHVKTTNQNIVELIEHMLHNLVGLIIGLCWMPSGPGPLGSIGWFFQHDQSISSFLGLKVWHQPSEGWLNNQEDNLPQMLHGAGIFTYIYPNHGPVL